MAAVLVASSLPHSGFPMAARRIPLAQVHNAVNSPRRPAAPTTKRPRSALEQKEDYGNSPVKKRHIIDLTEDGHRRPHVSQIDEPAARLHNNATTRGIPNVLTRKLAAYRQPKVEEKQEKATRTDEDTIRQWRRHYRKLFPQFVFYLESIPEDISQKMSRQIQALGARQERFFSRSVTHVVTTRPIPPNPNETATVPSQRASVQSQQYQPRTINPSLLDKHAIPHPGLAQQKGRVSENTSSRRSQILFPEGDARRSQANSNDVLRKAREMEMKIWALEKFERMMITMFTNSSTDEEQEAVTHRKLATASYATSRNKDDLTQLLRNEKNVTDRQQLWGDIVAFRGPHIYVFDMDEKTKPVMYREYNNVAHKDEGEWPMFHSVPPGRCPFVAEDPEKRDSRHAKEEAMTEKKVQAEQRAPMTRAASVAREANRINTKTEDQKKPALRENENAGNRLVRPEMVTAKPFEKPSLRTGLSGLDSMPPLLGSAHANFRGLARHPGGEPMASGVQPSNITSAIRSQMISSTAAAPVQRAATSKDMYNLQKRVLDRHSAARSATSNPSSYMNDVRAAMNDPQTRRITRRRAAETMTRIHEDDPLSEEDRRPIKQDIRASKRRKVVERETKPGYCENCREKYEDFNDHVETRTHRKFALTNDNWKELDALLKHLVRQ